MLGGKSDNIHVRRIRKLQKQLLKEKIDGLLISNLTNVWYLTGFPSSAAQLTVSGKGCVVMTDPRYIEAARKHFTFADVYLRSGDQKKDIRYLLRKYKVKRFGFESSHISYQRYLQLKDYIGEKRLKPRPDIVERLRVIKGPEEISVIRKAVRLSENGFRHIRAMLKPGVSEKEVARELEVFFVKKGGDGFAFDPIVAFGSGSAVPHHHTGTRKLRNKDMALIDWGAKSGGYSSDLTRTLLSHSMTAKEKEIYAIVLEAQQKAIDRIRPGMSLAALDGTARDVISRYGYGESFVHSLGHGLGLDVHEPPGVSKKSKARCRKGMVLTIEPGIYIPGWGGVRIEDDVLVTEKGCEVLSRLSKKAESF